MSNVVSSDLVSAGLPWRRHTLHISNNTAILCTHLLIAQEWSTMIRLIVKDTTLQNLFLIGINKLVRVRTNLRSYWANSMNKA